MYKAKHTSAVTATVRVKHGEDVDNVTGVVHRISRGQNRFASVTLGLAFFKNVRKRQVDGKEDDNARHKKLYSSKYTYFEVYSKMGLLFLV